MISSIMFCQSPVTSVTCLRRKNVQGGQLRSAFRTRDRLKKGYRFYLRCSAGCARSLTLPGLRFLDEFALAARLLDDRDRSICRLLDRLFRLLVVGSGHLDPVSRGTEIEDLDIRTRTLRFARLFQGILYDGDPVGLGGGEGQEPGHFHAGDLDALLRNFQEGLGRLLREAEFL